MKLDNEKDAKTAVALILTSCTNRKRVPPPRALTAHVLKAGTLEGVVTDWTGRMRRVAPTTKASDLYCGRAFRQAEAAALRLDAVFMVVSAGLGFVSASAMVPSYSLTVAPGSADNILDRIDGSPAASNWWQALNRASSFGSPLAKIANGSRGPILVALSGSYLSMIAEDLLSLPEKARSRLRIFTLFPRSELSSGLSDYVMPYDARFDGPGSPMPGTRGDFAQRTLAHFVETVFEASPRGSLHEHAAAVKKKLSRLRPPKPIFRTKASDDEILTLISRHWGKVGGQSSRMLRHLRDNLQIACEQSRFRKLFLRVSEARV